MRHRPVNDAAAQLLRLVAESEIRALSATYVRGLDRHDEALVRSVFTGDATTHYGTFRGGPDEMAAMAMRALGEHTATQHILGQINIWFGDDGAAGEVYFQAYHRAPIDGVPMDRFICGRYVDRYARIGGRDLVGSDLGSAAGSAAGGAWRIAHRTEVVDWTRTEPAADDYFSKRPHTVRGARDATDLSYRPDEA